MKSLIVIASLLAFQSTFACENLGEAQIIAKIERTETDSLTYCKAFINLSEVRFFSESMVCPLELYEIAQIGIEVGLENGHDCALNTNDEISGVVVKKRDNLLILE